jgi:phage-related protein
VKIIVFYKTLSGQCPIEKYLDDLTDTQVRKITWVLKLIRETDQVPAKYFKKLVHTSEIWEVRIRVGKNIFRLLGFMQNKELIILTNIFQKKAQKTSRKEIKLAEGRKKEYLNRR